MIIEYEHYDAKNAPTYDLCIVGSGAASLAMLTRLYDTGIRVLVIEAGGEQINDQDQSIYDSLNTHHPFPGAQGGRFRVFGGSTTQWGGQSLHLEPEDFEKRDWVQNSGWPISYADVAKYYPPVDEFLHLFPIDYKSDPYTLLKKASLKTDNNLTLKFSKWSPLPNLRENFRKRLAASANIIVLKNGNLTSINLNADFKEVSSLTVRNLNYADIIVHAKKYILACGGIENARLLLASNNQQSAGVGNAYDQVGRYLQDHPNAHIATLIPKDKNAQEYFNYFYIKKTRFLPRFVFNSQYQQQNKTLNCSAYFSFVSAETDSFSVIKDLYRRYTRGTMTRKDLGGVLSLFKNSPDLFKIAVQLILKKKVYTPNAILKLNLMTESLPLAENKVTLNTQKDALGMPKAVITWQQDDMLLHTFKKGTEYMKIYFDKLNLGEYISDDWMYKDDWFNQIKDANHHIGTTKMSISSNTGVVDVNCKVHGVTNLYIAGSSVFPTSGHSNPTTTLIALAFRLIDHLKNNIND